MKSYSGNSNGIVSFKRINAIANCTAIILLCFLYYFVLKR